MFCEYCGDYIREIEVWKESNAQKDIVIQEMHTDLKKLIEIIAQDDCVGELSTTWVFTKQLREKWIK